MALGRGTQREIFPLAASHTTTPQAKVINHKYIFISRLSSALNGLVRVRLDGTDMGFAKEGRRYDACEGEVYREMAFFHPALAGEMEVLACNGDSIPSDGGGGDLNGATLRRVLDLWYGPTLPAQNMSAPPFNGFAVGGAVVPMFTVETAGFGAQPLVTVRGHRCIICQPTAGASGLLATYSHPWQRLRLEGGGGGAQLASRLSARWNSMKVSALLRRDGLGAKSIGTGLQLAQGRGSQENISGGNAGAGIVADGADWWQFVARAVDAGPFTITDPLPRIPGFDALAWCRFGLEVVDADPIAGIEGSILVTVNGVPFASYAAANFWPAFNGADSTGTDIRLIDEGANADALCFSHVNIAVDSFSGGE